MHYVSMDLAVSAFFFWLFVSLVLALCFGFRLFFGRSHFEFKRRKRSGEPGNKRRMIEGKMTGKGLTEEAQK